jgi:hypothetical protein
MSIQDLSLNQAVDLQEFAAKVLNVELLLVTKEGKGDWDFMVSYNNQMCGMYSALKNHVRFLEDHLKFQDNNIPDGFKSGYTPDKYLIFIMELPQEELPLYINTYFEKARKIVEWRFKNKI